MDVIMSEAAERPNTSETPAVQRLRRALSTLAGSEQLAEHSIPTTFSLAQAFCNTQASPLRIYQAASHVLEGQLREVVQFLIFSGPDVALVIIRLLSIMRGLPGNWELTMEFLEQQTSDSFKSFPTRVFSLIAVLGGRKAYSLCDWSTIIERAFKHGHIEARWALCTMSEYLWKGPKESVLRVFEWDTELPHESDPSIWREIQWTSYAQMLCVNCQTSSPNNGSTAAEQEETDFEYLSSNFGAAAPHYVRICGTLLRRRSIGNTSPPLIESRPEKDDDDDDKVSRDHPVILTSTIRTTVCDMAAYLAYGVPFILEGPTGCGKTALLSFLARRTAYEREHSVRDSDAPGVTFIQMDNTMNGESFSSLVGCVVPIPEGGGFRWRPGPIGAAAERGDWIVFENIGRATGRMSSAAAIIRKLAEAKPGDKLEAPGRGEPIIMGRGFRCIATRTLSQEGIEESWAPPGGWDTWYRVTMNELSFDEKVEILSERHAQIADCIPRVVTVVEQVAQYTGNLKGPLFRTPTLREAVRICQRLELERRESGSLSPEIAFLETMDVLAAWSSIEEHFIKLSNVVSFCWSLSPQVAADIYSKHRPQLRSTDEKVKVGRASAAKSALMRQNDFSRLSLTGHTLRLLERTLRCLELDENVLLCGETGSGKTALMQELASLMGKKLVVVNLSRQSELDDLIGGFRPVDADAAVPLLAKRFESAFCQSMSKQKNAGFLDALQKASRSLRHHHRALRLMEGAFKAIPKSARQRSPSLRQEWEGIEGSLEKLTISYTLENCSYAHATPKASSKRTGASQEPVKKRPRVSSPTTHARESLQPEERRVFPPPRKRSRRIDFEFCDGVLVQVMREGDWILLDELNLAPPELLERLVSVLDVGQVALADEDGNVVSKKDGFVLFGAMNPPTDVGKRPLPSVLRSRFTEFHVGDMVIREDLQDLITHKFLVGSSSKDQTVRISNSDTEIVRDTVDFYLNSYEMARQGRIEDCTGKPVRFSLRSLSRMLDFASGLWGFLKNGSEGKRRALFEGSLAALGTQLPKKSQAQLKDMAESYLLSKSRGQRPRMGKLVDLMSIPRNKGISVRMLHGFPVAVNSLTSASTLYERPKYIITPAVEETLTDVCRALVVGAPMLPVLLQGPTAAGKSSLISYLAEQTGNKLIRINNHEHTEISEYIGGYVANEDGSLLFSEGPLIRAARNGDWVMLDELNLAPPDVLESLNRLLDDNREVFIPETNEVVKAANGFRLFATQNPPGLYGGRKELSRAFRSRFIEVQVDELPDQDLKTILEKRADVPASFARKMVAVLRDLQIRRRSSGLFSGREGYITARDLFRWASRGPRSKEELAIHGFLLLAERARSKKERSLLREVICKEACVALEVLSDESLYAFDLSGDGGGDGDGDDAAKQCLDFSLQKLSLDRASILHALSERNIVLSPSMRRMLTLLIHCMANGEPALLVGATGGGKTTSCGAIAAALSRQLLTINCHRHTEASDILGGFRPVRQQTLSNALFEWVDGPLVEAMKTGSWMLVDEINMTDDAVIERLNSVLESERTLLLAEKGTDKSSTSPEVVVAGETFRILATMNPGGDFGKKELSPALRNRFTELWIPPPLCFEDYLPIIHQRLGRSPFISEEWQMASLLVQGIVRESLGDSQGDSIDVKKDEHLLQISVRDLTSWCDFIVEAPKVCQLDPLLAAVHGSRLVFLDGLSVGLTSSHFMKLESAIWHRMMRLVPTKVRKDAEKARYTEGIEMRLDKRDACLKIDCFYIPCNGNRKKRFQDKSFSAFSFDAPNTVRNSARIARAMSVGRRPILLEGPPGSGKSSLIAALASASGFKYTRVNLSEGTEMSDLVGCDAPGEDQGSFVFRPGPLLEALSDGSWVLLDELNLASQSVLEGLNSVLDHRKTLFVPELNKEFLSHPSFRIFGAQNSAADGGGRRGLPKSFLNRFTRVHIEAPCKEDIRSIVRSIHPQLSSNLAGKVIECLQDLRTVKGSSCSRDKFGLRDALRWCDLLGGIGSNKMLRGLRHLSRAQLYTCFDAAVLRSLKSSEREAAEACFERAFGFACDSVRTSPSVRPQEGQGFRIGFATVENLDDTLPERSSESTSTLLVPSRCWELQAMTFAINAGWPVTLFSPSSAAARFGAKRIVQQIATLFGKRVTVFDGASLTDTEDFVGGYVQCDASSSMRLVVTRCEEVLLKAMNMNAGMKETLENANEAFPNTYVLLTNLRNILIVALRSQENTVGSLPSFLQISSKLVGRIGSSAILREDLKPWLSDIEKQCDDLKKLHQSFIAGDFAPFKWRKSSLMEAIEAGEWVYMQDADACPPALLDRLNPIFERAAVSAGEQNCAEHAMTLSPMILAEAPSNEDGSPVLLQPHPHFRMFFSVSKPVQGSSYCGLSKALLDRSLKICIEEDFSDHDNAAVARLASLSAGKWHQFVSRSGESEDSSDPSHREVLDGYTKAQRIRFTMRATLTRDANMETIANEERGVIRCLPCASGFWHSLVDLPFTNAGEYVDNPVLSSMERDVASLRLLETAPAETNLGFTDRVREVLGSSRILEDSNFLELSNQQAFTHEAAKQMLLVSGANAFLFGSTSLQDLRARAILLRKRATLSRSSAHRSVYLNRSDAALQCISSLESLEEHHLPSLRWRAFPVPLDPLFALDQSSVNLAFLEDETEDARKVFMHRGKRLRAELLALHRLRETWRRAKESAADDTFFTRAKLTYLLQNKKLVAEGCADGSLKSLVFDAVSSAGASIDAYCRLIQLSDKWEISNEVEWMQFFAQSTCLCELMLAGWEPAAASLAAILYNIALTLDRIEDRVNPCFDGLLEGLHQRLQAFKTNVGSLLLASEQGAAPTSRIGQGLEMDLIKTVINRGRGELSVAQIDAVVNALATLTIQRYDREGCVLAELRKVAELIKETSSHSDSRKIALDHWSRTVHQTGIRAAQDAINAPVTQEVLQSSIISVQKEAIQVVNDCVRYMKCLSHSNISSVACLQKLLWIVESASRTGKTQSTCIKSSYGNIGALTSLSLLHELNSFLAPQHIPEDNGTCKQQRGVSSLSASLFLAQGSSVLPFWTLSQAYAEAACAVALISRGKHKIDHITGTSKIFLQRCFESVSDRGSTTMNSTNLATVGEKFNGTPVVTSNSSLVTLRPQSHVQLEGQDDLVATVQCALQHDVSLSVTDKILQFGRAWVSLGLMHLNSSYGFVKRSNGIDPAQFSLSIASLALEEMQSSSASSSAFDVFASHRLGGESFSESVPAERLSRAKKADTDIIVTASTGHVFRPPEKTTYESYESFVDRVHATVTSRIIDTGLLGKLHTKHSPVAQEQVFAEAAHLAKSSEALSSDLKCEGSFGHFRDISTNLAIGLQEVQYGLCLFRKASEMYSIVSSPLLEKQVDFVLDVMLFPRMAHRQSTGAIDCLKRCMKLSVDANCIMALANYLVGGQSDTSKYHSDDTSLILSEIVSEWKKRTLADEREVEKKESLHVLREVGRKEMIPFGDIAERLEIDEDADFVETFNPITPDEEEELCGLSSPQSTTPESVKSGTGNNDVREDAGRRISPESFWHLHKSLYPPLMQAHRGSQTLADRIQQLSAFSSHLFSLISGVIPAIEDISSVWETFASHFVSQMHAVSFLPANNIDNNFCHRPSEAPYNFYTDANIEELMTASTALRSLSSAISRVQQNSFKETGNHPVLEEVEVAIQRVAKSCKTSTPLSRVILAIENVLRKADEWQRLFATSNTRLDAQVLQVAKVVARWRRLEVQSWPHMLQSRVTACEKQGCKWMFLLYDAILHEGMRSLHEDPDCIRDVIASVDRFLRSSTLGEFGTRLELVRSLGRHVLTRANKNDERTERLGRSLIGLGEYYGLFLSGVHHEITNAKRAVDKDLSQFTQLTSWNASHDLGSSCKMFREKDKYLQYYRLKTAAEKTRRKLHKLCLKVDAIVRVPVHESLSRQLSRIGFFSSVGEEGNSESKGVAEIGFSDRIRGATQVLTQGLLSAAIDEAEGQSNVKFTSLGDKGSLLSQVYALEEKLNNLGEQVKNLSNTKCEIGTKFCNDLRSVMRDRILKLRDTRVAAHIQVKKRALVELFKILQKSGISPFERTIHVEPHEWLSAPTPSLCEEYNAVANELFWKSALQVQRLEEVSDSRLRNPDLANGDASRVRAFCRCLFDQACAQRSALGKLFDNVQTLSKDVNALSRLKFDEDTRCQLHWISKSGHDLRLIFLKLQEILVDLLASEEVFKQVIRNVQHTKSVFRSSTDQVGFLIETHSKDSFEVLRALARVLSFSIAAVKETVTDQELTSVEGNRGSGFAFVDGAYAKAFLEAKEKLSKLATVLNEQCAKAMDISPDSFVAQVLTPVTSFINDTLNAHTSSVCGYGDTREYEFDKVWSQINEDANAVIEAILIGSQQVLAWNDLNVTTEGLQNTNQSATLEESSLSEVAQSGLMKAANKKVLSLSSALNVSQLLRILHRNEDSIHLLSETDISFAKLDKVCGLQRVLARFTGRYLNTMIIPCLQKASQFHAHSLSLLRSLSSVFIGLCVEGFCRPPEFVDSPESCEVDGRHGGGFGEAGDGDMSSAQNISDQIEDEEQLLGLRDDLQKNIEGSQPQMDEDQSQDGVDMTTDFDGELLDLNEEEGPNGESDEPDKEMASEPGIGDNVIDQRLWGNSDEPNTDSQSQDKDSKKAKNPSANNATSDLVVKNEETARVNEQQADSDCQEKRHEYLPEDEEGEAESGLEDDKNCEKKDTGEEEEVESFANVRKENPFNTKMDTDSDDDGEDAGANPEDDSNPSQDPSPKRADDSSNREHKSNNIDVEVDKGADSRSASGESDIDDHETESIFSDAADRDAEQEGPMVGAEQPKDFEHTDDDVEAPAREDSEVPGDLDLEDCNDTWNMTEEEEKEEASREKSTDNNQMETSPTNDIEKHDEGANMDGNESTLENGNNIPDQQQQSLSEAMTMRPSRGHNAVGNERIEDKDKNPLSNDQGDIDNRIDDDGFPAREGEKDLKSTTGGSRMQELQPTANQSMSGDVRQNKESPQPDTDNPNSFRQHPNPLRVSRPEELVEAWERHLKVMEKEQENSSVELSPRASDEGNGLWQYQDAKDADEKNMHALGAATDEQQFPLTAEEEEENPDHDKVQDPLRDEADGSREDPSALPAMVTDERTVRQRQSEEPSAATSDTPVTKEEHQIALKSHPAHKAAEGVTESITPTVKPPNLNRHEKDSEHMEVDIADEPKTEDVPSVDDKLTWKMEMLDGKAAIELWHRLDMKVSAGASSLCEQLRLVLEPTVVSGLSGGFRTGKKLNMRKVIEYVASDFQKDRIWLRRVKPDKRSYDVLVAIDDSASMAESDAGAMAIESLALVLAALSRLEIGRVGVARFGAEAEMIRNFDEALPLSVEGGAELLQKFSFSQKHTDVVELLSFVQSKMGSNLGLGDVEHVSLAFVISDGRLSNREEVRRQLRHLKNSNVLIAFIILDQVIGDQRSIYELKRVDYDKDGNLTISPYMEDFPIDFYTTVQDVRSLPAVLGDALRQWVEAANM